MAHRDTPGASGGEQPARQQVLSQPDATASGFISSLSALEFCQELYLSPTESKNNLDELIIEIYPFPPVGNKIKIKNHQDISFQVAVYLCKLAASRLLRSILLFALGSAEVYFCFSKWGILCLRCALPTSLGHW